MSEEGENLIYECFKCGRAFTKSEWERTGEFKCPNCVKPDTMILGDNKPILQYLTGCKCIGNGKLTRVLKTYKRHYDGKMIVLYASGMLPISLTPEHPILVATGHRAGGECTCTVKRHLKGGIKEYRYKRPSRIALSPPLWKKAEDVTPKHRGSAGDYLIVPKIEWTESRTKLDLTEFVLGGYRGRRVAEARGAPLEFPLNEKSAWLLGLYVAEGCSGKGPTFSLGKHETTLLQKLLDTLKETGYTYSITEAKTAIHVEINSRILSRAFLRWCGRGARNKQLPDFILFHKDKALLKSFLEGYVAGDGYPVPEDKKKRQVAQIGCSTVSKVLALQLQLAFARLDKFAHIYIGKTKSTIENRSVRSGTCYIIKILLNPRKVRYRILEKYIATPIRAVAKENYNGYVYNLETEDETYLVSNAVVHNCGFRVAKKVKPPIAKRVRTT